MIQISSEQLLISILSGILSFFETSGMLLAWSCLSHGVQLKKGIIPTFINAIVFGIFMYFNWDVQGLFLLALFFILSCHMFRRSYGSEILEFFSGVIIYIITEFILGYMLQAMLQTNTNHFYIGVLVHMFAISGLLLIKKRIPTHKYFNQLKANKYSKYSISTIMVILLCVLVMWKYQRELGEYYLLLIAVALTLMVVVNYVLLVKSSQIELKDKALKVYEDYMPVISDLVDEVRAQQHDYKNHLHAMYMMVLEEEYENLKRYAEDYIDLTKFHNKMMAIDDKIITGIIYSKVCEAEKYKIPVRLDMDHLLPKYPMEKYELVGLLGNLLDNAIEANMNTQIAKPFIELKILEKESVAYIEVTNTYQGGIDTVHMFDKGYSSKGENRGFGLYNIKKLVNAHHGTIQVQKDDVFTIRILFKIEN